MKRVLLAEDDPETATAIKATLEERLPVAVNHVPNGALVLDQIMATHRDLVILDVSIPGLNGIDVFDLLRGSAPFVEVSRALPHRRPRPRRAGVRALWRHRRHGEAVRRRWLVRRI